jgi:hypothetical protein
MPDAPAPAHASSPDSPLLSHLVSQLTVIKAHAQLVRRRIHQPGANEAHLASEAAAQERSLAAIDKAVELAMFQLIGAGERGRMPIEPLVESDDAA